MKVAVVDDSMEDRELLAGTAEETLCALGQGQTFLQLFPSGEMLLKDFQPGKLLSDKIFGKIGQDNWQKLRIPIESKPFKKRLPPYVDDGSLFHY